MHPLLLIGFYNLLRERNEAEMSDAAQALGEDAETKKEDTK